MRPLILILFLAPAAVTQAATTRVSLGYGLQLNSFLNSALNANLKKMILNDGGKNLTGITGVNSYDTTWAGSEADVSAYPLVHLPELRFSADWGTPQVLHWGIFASLSGMVPQTSAYYPGSYQLKENATCAGVDYAKCALAATNFVASSGTATYSAELRSHLRFTNIVVGVTLGKKIGSIWAGEVFFSGEAGVNVQTFAVNTQFVASRCSNGGSTPCAQNAQVRVVQSELNTSASYALGPVLGASFRYERPQAFWFVEAGATVVFLFSRWENSGYTDFIAAGTQAFSQTSVAQGVEETQNNFAVLPGVVLRLGVRL